MNTTVIATTNPATGTITTITIVHQHHFHYGWFVLAVLAVALICSGLRALFWNKDSN
jgi:endoglucanase Acf2